MKITNKCAGEWRLFSEGLPPEENNVWIIVTTNDAGRRVPVLFVWITDLWCCWEVGVSSHTTAELAEQYDAYCIIRGPWE
jgi:hypothetical protein